MSDKQSWRDAVFIDPAALKTKPDLPPDVMLAREIPPGEVRVVDEQQQELTPPLETAGLSKKFSRWKKLFAGSVATLLVAGVLGELYRLLSWGFELHPLLGFSISGLIGLAGVSGLVWVYQGFKGARQLKITEALHAEANVLKGQKSHGLAAPLLLKLDRHYQSTPLNQPFKEALRQVDSAYNDGEIIQFISSHALRVQDEAARQCVHRYSVQSGVMVGLSPFASFDMWLIAWRNMKMLSEITAIYGITPGAATQWGLIKRVLHNIAFAGLSEMGIHAASNILGSSLAATVSAKAGQGIGAGLFTARTGLQAIKLCRPLPLELDEQRQLTGISQSILASVRDNKDQG